MSKMTETTSRIAQLGRGRLFQATVHLYPDHISYKGTDYPVAGAHAEVTDIRSGLVGRKHTTEMVVTTTAGQFVWSATAAGTQARLDHHAATRFAATLNTAALVPDAR
jgi:hypothetical protein